MSYLNRLGSEPFKFLNVGQVLKSTATKHPDREAIVSCNEGIRLTFAEALYKVSCGWGGEARKRSKAFTLKIIPGRQACCRLSESRTREGRSSGDLVPELRVLVHQHVGHCTSRLSLRNSIKLQVFALLATHRKLSLQVALNPAYQEPEMDFCLKKVGVKAIIAPESFRKQKLYEMLMNLKRSGSASALQHIIIATDNKLP